MDLMSTASDFSTWLEGEMKARDWRQADLIDRTGINSGHLDLHGSGCIIKPDSPYAMESPTLEATVSHLNTRPPRDDNAVDPVHLLGAGSFISCHTTLPQ